MITEQYVSFETAKLLKEKGFDIPCNSLYRKTLKENKLFDEPNLYIASWLKNNTDLKKSEYSDIVYCVAPTQALVMRWLREVHQIFLCVEYTDKSEYYVIVVNTKTKEDLRESEKYSTYEETCEEAIKYCLENLI